MKKGRILIRIGIVLITCAVALTVYNLVDNMRAGHEAQQATEFLAKAVATEEPLPVLSPEEMKFPAATDVRKEVEIPDYVLNPKMEMPVVHHNGQDYIGILEIPVLDLKIPIISKWNYPSLRIAPCRYTGSAYTNDLVISGHNYPAHFGALHQLDGGERIIFTDADGNVFNYRVEYAETLQPKAVDDMVNSGWDLSLFTCTVGGSYRVTVRCSLIKDMLMAN